MGKPAKTIYVLTSKHNDYDQHGQYFLGAFAEKPSLEVLAAWFKDAEGLPHNIMEAVAFLENLRAGKDASLHNGEVYYYLKLVELQDGQN